VIKLRTANYTVAWTFVPLLDQPARANVFGVRLGTNLNLGLVRKALSVWVGANRQALNSNTSGHAEIVELVPADPGDLEDFLSDYQNQEWYQNLPAPTKKIVDDIVDQILSLDPTGWTIDYQVQKKPEKLWNLALGAQMYLTPNWQFRTELGVGDRTSLLVSLNYRFSIR
jgi:hypothetical protein